LDNTTTINANIVGRIGMTNEKLLKTSASLQTSLGRRRHRATYTGIHTYKNVTTRCIAT